VGVALALEQMEEWAAQAATMARAAAAVARAHHRLTREAMAALALPALLLLWSGEHDQPA